MDLIWTIAAQRVNHFLSNVCFSNKEVKTVRYTSWDFNEVIFNFFFFFLYVNLQKLGS